MRITVFTPTYNRGYTIERLYRSLQRQVFDDFEWIVIDDGSNDNTEALFQTFLRTKNQFPITYKKVSNGGKHRAINIGVQMAQGELFFIVDSDDYLTDRALEEIDKIEKSIPESEKSLFAGVCGQRGYSADQQIGKTFQGEILDITSLERQKYGISGDKAEVFYTQIMKDHPFPSFENEKFITECVVWDKIAIEGHKLRFFNAIIYITEYLPDGLTAHSEQLFLDNPKGYGLYLHQCGMWGKFFGVQKWNAYLKYYYQFREKLKFSEIAKNLHMNSLLLRIRLIGLQLFYKIYDR